MFQATLSGLAVGSLFALIAVGFNLTFIVNRTVNFAHGQWVAVGSLLAFTLLVEWQMPLLVTIIGTGVLLGILGIALERVGIRPMLGHSLSLGFIMSTLAIGIMLESAALWWWGSTAQFVPSPLGEERMEVFGAGIYPQEAVIPAVTALMLVGLALLYRFTRLGRALRATAENPEAARLMGIDAKRMVGLAYGLAGLMAGVAGVLVAPLTGALAAAGRRTGSQGIRHRHRRGARQHHRDADRGAPARCRRAVHRAVHLAGAARCRGLHDRHRDPARPPLRAAGHPRR